MVVLAHHVALAISAVLSVMILFLFMMACSTRFSFPYHTSPVCTFGSVHNDVHFYVYDVHVAHHCVVYLTLPWLPVRACGILVCVSHLIRCKLVDVCLGVHIICSFSLSLSLSLPAVDDTRVKLDDNDNDYVNANFVTVSAY